MASADSDPLPKNRSVDVGAEPKVNTAVIFAPDTVKATLRNT